MLWQLYIPGLLLGIASSFHCIGMCGPIALLLPVQNLTPAKRFSATLLYNCGRVFTYVAIGCFLGIVGRRVYIAGFQQAFSIALGCIVLVLLFGLLFNRQLFHRQPSGAFFRGVQQLIAKQLRSQHRFALFLTGVGNGLLPCGMVYFALAGALATGSIVNSAVFMAGFGTGTIPLMMLVSHFGKLISMQARNKIKMITPYFVAMMAVVLILRGLNLDIPYISPFFSRIGGTAVSCH